MANPDPSPETRFKVGNPGGPGRPRGRRDEVNADFIEALTAQFKKEGADAITRACATDPMGYVRMVASLQPKQIEPASALDDLTDLELDAATEELRAKVARQAGEGTGPAEEPPPTS